MFDKREDILIVVKAYPNPSKKYQETVCVAGIVPNKGWIRLYPVRFRHLPLNRRFKKYEILNLELSRQRKDPRPESYCPNMETIKKVAYLDTKSDKMWERRKDIVLRFIDESMCDIQRKQNESNQSLGLFKPKNIIDFLIVEKDPKYSEAEKSVYYQGSIFESGIEPLEKIPFSFKYLYECNNTMCRGHQQIIIDWEVYQLYRNLRDKHGDDVESIKKDIKYKFLDYIFSANRDPYFYTGNLARHPTSFVLLGIFWPPK